MAGNTRPLSPHINVYRWQVQMVTSILHRATGIALSVGLLVIVWALIALASGEQAWETFVTCAGSPIGIILLVGWSWSLFYHLCNGIRHLLQDAGLGFNRRGFEWFQFVRSSWLSIIFSVALTIIAWALVGVLS